MITINTIKEYREKYKGFEFFSGWGVIPKWELQLLLNENILKKRKNSLVIVANHPVIKVHGRYVNKDEEFDSKEEFEKRTAELKEEKKYFEVSFIPKKWENYKMVKKAFDEIVSKKEYAEKMNKEALNSLSQEKEKIVETHSMPEPIQTKFEDTLPSKEKKEYIEAFGKSENKTNNNQKEEEIDVAKIDF